MNVHRRHVGDYTLEIRVPGLNQAEYLTELVIHLFRRDDAWEASEAVVLTPIVTYFFPADPAGMGTDTAWVDECVQEIVSAHQYAVHGSNANQQSQMPTAAPVPDLLAPGTYHDKELRTFIVTGSRLRKRSFSALQLDASTGQVVGETRADGPSLKPINGFSYSVRDAALAAPAADGSRRSLSHNKGCLLGLAVGDALGAAVNGLSLGAIQARYGRHGITEFSPTFGRIGAITAHTQLAMFTAEGLIRAEIRGNEKGICNPPGVVRFAYCRWLLAQGISPEFLAEKAWFPDGWLFQVPEFRSHRDPSTTTIEALQIPEMGTIARPVNTSKGCAALARTVPVGLTDWDDHFSMGMKVTALTHGHRTAYLAGGFLSVVIAALVGGRSLRAAIAAGLELLHAQQGREDCVAAVERALDRADRIPPSAACVEELGRGWTADEALAISLYCSLTASSFEAGVLLAVNHGGDSDATGAITGAILGTLHGVEAIPPRWLDKLELGEEIGTLATDLYLEFGGSRYATALGASNWDRYPGW